jgi:AcrR family transcriptional regulator
MAVRSRKGADSREAVVHAAKRLFATQGYQATSVQQIADAVGRSQSAVMHYFPAKTDIFAAVLEEMISIYEQLRDTFNDPKANAVERLMNHFELNYRWAVEIDHHAQIMTGLFHFASYDATFSALYTAIIARARSSVLELLHAGARERLFALPEDPERCADVLHDGLLGFLLTTVSSRPTPNAKAKQLLKWQLLVAGVTRHGRTTHP